MRSGNIRCCIQLLGEERPRYIRYPGFYLTASFAARVGDHELDAELGGYQLIHRPTGFRLTWVANLGLAREAAELLEPLADWGRKVDQFDGPKLLPPGPVGERIKIFLHEMKREGIPNAALLQESEE